MSPKCYQTTHLVVSGTSKTIPLTLGKESSTKFSSTLMVFQISEEIALWLTHFMIEWIISSEIKYLCLGPNHQSRKTTVILRETLHDRRYKRVCTNPNMGTGNLFLTNLIYHFTRGWIGDESFVFFGDKDSGDHVFVVCPYISKIWQWIAACNGFQYNCQTSQDLWFIDTCIPLKDRVLIELHRGAIMWTIWLERNRLIFKGATCKNSAMMGAQIIAMASFWCQKKIKNKKMTHFYFRDTKDTKI